MARTYLSLGSNMGQRRRLIKKAIAMLSQNVGTIVAQSSVIETEAWGFSSQQKFLNAVVSIDTSLTPRQLLEATQAIEQQLGRTHKTQKDEEGRPVEGQTYSDRYIDIDILLYDDIVVNEPDLKIPHPLMHERPFVMLPLREIYHDGIAPFSKYVIKTE